MINIEMPEWDLEVNYDELNTIPVKEGIYVLYSEDDEALYTGKTSNLKNRVYSHFSGNSNTGALHYYFHHAKMFFEENAMKRDIYETFVINYLKTEWNKSKCFTFETKAYKYRVKKKDKWEKFFQKGERCKHIKNNGERCKAYAHENGYCYSHQKINVLS